MKDSQIQFGCYPVINTILCADWSKETRRRAVYAADVTARRVYRLQPKLSWSLQEILEAAADFSAKGLVLAAFDVPLGVPESYLAAAGAIPSWKSSQSFLELLRLTCSTPKFFEATSDPADWRIDQPFFSVPVGKGGLTGYVRAAAEHGIDLRRSIDKRTKAKTLFIKSGIPGSVGSAACSLWAELGPLLDSSSRRFGFWPFDGELGSLLRSLPVVLAEMYPRAAYATALADEPVSLRAPMALAKTDANVRRLAIASLKAARWVEEHSVRMEDLADALANEDDFDACMTAAAFLRCQLEQVPLCEPWVMRDRVEGGILGTASINLALKERMFGSRLETEPAITLRRPESAASSGLSMGRFACPIAGCDKVYHGTRGGWDGHVGSLRIHPFWRPEIPSAEERKKQFVIEFPGFFR